MYPCKRIGAVDTLGGVLPLTRENQSTFMTAIEGCLGNGQPRIVFDLSGIPLIDSAGLEALLDARDLCQKRGGSIILARPNPLCRDILKVTGIDKELQVFDDSVKAMGSFSR